MQVDTHTFSIATSNYPERISLPPKGTTLRLEQRLLLDREDIIRLWEQAISDQEAPRLAQLVQNLLCLLLAYGTSIPAAIKLVHRHDR